MFNLKEFSYREWKAIHLDVFLVLGYNEMENQQLFSSGTNNMPVI